MFGRKTVAGLGVLLGFGIAAAPLPSLAQKAQDTIRLAINDPFAMIDSYTQGHEEANTFTRTIFQSLISLDEHKKAWVPVLAESFKRIDDKTLEFKLRKNITYHNGAKFDADDVKYTLDYITAPDTKIVFKSRYTWIGSTEILDPYTVRVHAKRAYSTALGQLAFRIRIYDKETHEPLSDKSDYGRPGKGAGTGPYKLVSLDRNRGMVVERYDAFTGDKNYFPAPVKRVEGIFIPDRQTRIAQLLTGGIDLMRNIGPDEAAELQGKPALDVTTTPSGVLLFVTLDAIGRSANKAMMDERVRKAFMMAIDRDTLVKNIIPGGKDAYIAKGICLPSMFGCGPTVEPYKYDPAQAKKLLAEAGFANGLDLTIHVYDPVKNVAEAIAGEVRKVGIRASVESMPLSVYVKRRDEGEFTTFVNVYPTGTQPDMASLWDLFFSGSRDYWKDDAILKAVGIGDSEMNDTKRAALYVPALNRVNEKAYIFPISEMPMLWAHNKDVVVKENPLNVSAPVLGDFFWKK